MDYTAHLDSYEIGDVALASPVVSIDLTTGGNPDAPSYDYCAELQITTGAVNLCTNATPQQLRDIGLAMLTAAATLERVDDPEMEALVSAAERGLKIGSAA